MSDGALDRNDDPRSAVALRLAVDCVIAEAAEENAERVALAIAEVVKRCRAEGRYSAEEIEAAAAQLCQELRISYRPG